MVLFSKWESERSLLRCDIRYSNMAACLQGRIFSLSNGEIKIASGDTFSELVVALDKVVSYGYGEPRTENNGADEFVSGMGVYFADFPPDSEPDYIFFSEYKKP